MEKIPKKNSQKDDNERMMNESEEGYSTSLERSKCGFPLQDLSLDNDSIKSNEVDGVELKQEEPTVDSGWFYNIK
jgi:hypothetical protein